MKIVKNGHPCQVAQTVVSDLLTTPAGDPNAIIERLVEDIKTSLKEK